MKKNVNESFLRSSNTSQNHYNVRFEVNPGIKKDAGMEEKADSVFQYLFGMPRSEVVRKLRALADDLDSVRERDHTGAHSVAIYDWALAKRAVPCLIGRAKSHPTIEDGHPLFSSELYYLDEERGIARTLSRWYQLGNRLDPDSWNQRYGGRQ